MTRKVPRLHALAQSRAACGLVRGWFDIPLCGYIV